MDEYLQQAFDDSFDDAYEYFLYRKQNDREFSRDFLQGLLESLYVRQGNNWDGRGQAKDLAQSGMIAAAEMVLQQWDEPGNEKSAQPDA